MDQMPKMIMADDIELDQAGKTFFSIDFDFEE